MYFFFSVLFYLGTVRQSRACVEAWSAACGGPAPTIRKGQSHDRRSYNTGWPWMHILPVTPGFKEAFGIIAAYPRHSVGIKTGHVAPS
jgi:hypothetical protein